MPIFCIDIAGGAIVTTQKVFDSELQQRLTDCGAIAVLIVDRAEDAVPLAKALLEGGIGAMELTLRTTVALDALHQIKQHVSEMIAGVGTILSPRQVSDVADAGAAFGVAPGMNRRVLDAAIKRRLSFAPGVATPSDVEQALEFDCRLLKFFPAEPSGGLGYLKSMAAPYAHFGLQYVPLGGVNAINMKTYLEDPLIAAVGGSWIATRDLIRDHDWRTITERASEASDTVARIVKESR